MVKEACRNEWKRDHNPNSQKEIFALNVVGGGLEVEYHLNDHNVPLGCVSAHVRLELYNSGMLYGRMCSHCHLKRSADGLYIPVVPSNFDEPCHQSYLCENKLSREAHSDHACSHYRSRHWRSNFEINGNGTELKVLQVDKQ